MLDPIHPPKPRATAAQRQPAAAREPAAMSSMTRDEQMRFTVAPAGPPSQAATWSPQARWDGSPRMVMQRRQLQLAFGAPAPVQRVKTPGLPDELPEGLDPQTFFHNHLFTLKWQLATGGRRQSQEMQEVDRLLGLAEQGQPVARSDLAALIANVDLATPDAKQATPTREEALTEDEILVLKGLLSDAELLAGTLSQSPQVLAEVFDTEATQAAHNFGLIKTHLAFWRAEPETRATIDRTSLSFGAFNIGRGDTSKLTLTSRFATDDRAAVLRTLIHEASHGRLGTKDVAYLSAPYFLKVTRKMALGNADHYAYAALRQGGSPALQPAAEGAVPTIEQAFQGAVNLCVFKCQRVWPVMKYLVDKYNGLVRDVFPDTIDANEDGMALGGRTGVVVDDPNSWLPIWKPKIRVATALAPVLLPICIERSRMFEEVLDLLSSFLQHPHALVALEGGETELQPLGGGNWPTVRFNVEAAQNVTALAEHIFITALTHFTFNDWQARKLFSWNEAMFASILQDKAHQEVAHVSPELLALQEILLGR